jgi:hypothetical protein
MKRKIRQNAQRIQRAAGLYEDFTGDAPRYVETVQIEIPRVVMLVGECDGVLYSCKRDRKLEHYIHKFKKQSRPLLCTNETGSALFLIGGSYSFTERGIVDK